MALNIPNVDSPGNSFLKGIDTGSAMFSRLIQPVLEREKRKQQEEHFKQELALRKQAAARAGANSDLHRQILQQQLLGIQHKNDPNYEMQQFQKLMEQFGSPRQQEPGPMVGEEQGLQAPQPNGPPHNTSALEALKNNPMLRGFFKHKFGFDPLAASPETPEQKHEAAINQAVSIDEAKSNRKKIDEIEKTAQALLPYLGKVNTISDILKRKPDLAGRTTQLADIMGMTKDEDVGTFLSAAQALQAHMAKEMSSRGGYGVSKLVEQAKPNIGKSTAYNKGVIKDLRRGMKESFDQMSSEYKRLTGKKLPYDFEQYFKDEMKSQGDMVPMLSPHGKKVMIPRDKIEAALAAGGKYG